MNSPADFSAPPVSLTIAVPARDFQAFVLVANFLRIPVEDYIVLAAWRDIARQTDAIVAEGRHDLNPTPARIPSL